MKKNLLELYRNYLFALQAREEYGDKYGDTKEIIENYEEQLKIKVRDKTKENKYELSKYSAKK